MTQEQVLTFEEVVAWAGSHFMTFKHLNLGGEWAEAWRSLARSYKWDTSDIIDLSVANNRCRPNRKDVHKELQQVCWQFPYKYDIDIFHPFAF